MLACGSEDSTLTTVHGFCASRTCARCVSDPFATILKPFPTYHGGGTRKGDRRGHARAFAVAIDQVVAAIAGTRHSDNVSSIL